jgi:tetratricopeptide (TPR) repeat protein
VTEPPARQVQASGTRSVAAGQLGMALTGDNPQVDARSTSLAAGAIPEPATVVPPPGINNLPRRPARVFVGREAALGQVGGALDEAATAVVTQAIYGLGGVGKSELALQHAHARQGQYTLTWWITAEDPDQLQAGLAGLAGRLCPAIALAGTTAEAAGWATGWLQAHQGWLLVLDNVTDPADVGPLLGQLTGGHILVTTRRDTGWDQAADPIRLDVLDPGPAADLLTTRTGQHEDASRDAAASVAGELGGLPLALDQAAAYITQTRITLGGYLDRLRQHPQAMYAATGGGLAQRAIARTWDITIGTIGARDPGAIELLSALACYAPDDIPRTIIAPGDPAGQLAADEALGLLASYSMITLTAQTVSLHRLVQAVILAQHPPGDHSPEPGTASPLATAAEWLDNAIPAEPDTNVAGWPLLRALIPHADALAGHFGADGKPVTLARIQNELAVFQDSQGQYQQSLTLRRSALAIYEAALGPDHPDTATALANLAATYGSLGQHAEALPLEQRALAVTEAALGPDHPDTAIGLGNLAMTYWSLGRHGEALPLEQRALAVTEAALGPDHPSTANRLSNLAATYGSLGRHGEALPLEQRALAVTEAALGPDHPSTAVILDNLGGTYVSLGRHGEALLLRQRALAVTEAALGPDHPSTATVMANLAFTYGSLGRPGEALPLERRALAVAEAALGPDHPDTAVMLGNLAETYGSLGRHGEALPLQQRALAVTEAALGPDHPSTAIRLANLAGTYGALGRHGEALPLQQRALAVTEAALGPDHPDTATRLANLAGTYRSLGRHGEALPLQQRALAVTEAALGPDHPSTATALANLAETYGSLGRDGEALALQQRALAIPEAARPGSS